MFNELTNFKLVRSVKEAFGFYCTYFLLTMLGMLLLSRTLKSFLLSDITPESTLFVQLFGTLIALIACLFLAYRILRSKKLVSNPPFLVYLSLTALLTVLGGLPLGMFLVAHLTTIDPGEEISGLPVGIVPTQELSDPEARL